MPRDICAISEDLSPSCLTACDYDALGRRLDGYDEGGNLFRDHAYQQPEGDKQVAIKVGRYISSDPIGIAGGLNTFGYVGQNPVMWIDPRGLEGDINLGQDWTGRLDPIEATGSSNASFEIHVFNPSGDEVGLYGPEGWFDKHGKSGKPPGVPNSVCNQLRGQSVDYMRRAGDLPDKGKGNIKKLGPPGGEPPGILDIPTTPLIIDPCRYMQCSGMPPLNQM